MRRGKSEQAKLWFREAHLRKEGRLPTARVAEEQDADRGALVVVHVRACEVE